MTKSALTPLLLYLCLGPACTTLHLPQVYLRASLTPSVTRTDGARASDVVSFDAGLIGPLGEVDPPVIEPEEPLGAPSFRSGAPCRVSTACAWERRAVAEARARVIGGQP